jgi:hypothetical protein
MTRDHVALVSKEEKNKPRPRIERGSPDDFFVSKLAKVKLDLAKENTDEAKNDITFKQLIERTLLTGGRTSYIQICAPFELYALTRLIKPKHVVEVGVSAGVSTSYLLLGLQKNGEGGVLHSIDLPEIQTRVIRGASWALPPGKKSGWAVPSHLKKSWDLRLGKSSEILPTLVKEIDAINLFIYDVPYEIDEAIGDFGIVNDKLRKGSVALADNCLVPISWWAKKRRATLHGRKNSGFRGFRVS